MMSEDKDNMVDNTDIKFNEDTNDKQQQTKNCSNIPLNEEFKEDEEDVTYEEELDELFPDENPLPEGWIKLKHDNGMPAYINEELKVCSFAKPYFLGVNSLKNHEVPVANIPCLDYKLKLQKKMAIDNGETPDDLPVTLSHEKYQDYCGKIFKFKKIKFMRFSSWDKRREYIRSVKAERRQHDLPKLKDKSQLMSFPVQFDVKNDDDKSTPEKEWTINLNGKSFVSILHEYIQRVLKTQPSYQFKELENARYPYLATVIIDCMQYGVGIGSSKKQAKLDAARATLEILLPSVKNQIPVSRRNSLNERQGSSNVDGVSIFDTLKIKDSRIPEFCAQAAESMPFDMLLVCIKRNFGDKANVKSEMQAMQSSSDSEIFYRCTMSVNDHSATVICKNKREGRQKGAQALLKLLHPHINHFGSLLRLYSHQNFGRGCEKKLDEPGNLSPKPRNFPNYDILKRLRTEMSKLESK